MDDSNSGEAIDPSFWADYLADELSEVQEYKPFAVEVINATGLIDTEPPEPNQVVKGLFDTGDKIALIGPSKSRKSFFLLQLAFSLSTGTDFFNLVVPTGRKVLFVQYEIKPEHFHKRVRSMAQALGVESSYIEDRLHVINARGTGITLLSILKIINDGKFEVVIFDPLYKLFPGDESDSEAVKEILSFFDLIVEKGCALIYSHHDRKGSNSKQDLTDRGSGTGIIGRDYDAAMFLSEHKQPDTLILDFITRNYSSPLTKVIEWFEYSFIISELEPISKKAGARAEKSVEDLTSKALNLLGFRKVGISVFREEIQQKLGLTLLQQRALISSLFEDGHIKETYEKSKSGNSKKVQRVEKEIPDPDRLF